MGRKFAPHGGRNCLVWGGFVLIALFFGCAPEAPEFERYDQYFNINGSWSASHILISYKGASRAASHVERDREEAREKAIALQERLLEDPSLFNEMAVQESDGPAARVAGYLGAWEEGAMAPEFQDALSALEIGELTTAPVESPFGFHIIRRESISLRHYACDAFFIAFKGSPSTPAVITRSREDALELAKKVGAKLKPSNFDQLAKEYNDLGDGVLPLEVVHEKKPLPFDVVKTLDPLAFGEVVGPVEMPIGFAFLRRAVVEQFAGSHILISFKGAKGARPDVTRTKEEALNQALELLETLKVEPERFSELAEAHSSGPNASRGGYLGVWFRGKMVKAFDNAIASLPIDGIAPEPVETEFGYHVIKRKATPSPGS